MTWTSLKSTGRGQVELFLELTGVPYMFGTTDRFSLVGNPVWDDGHYTAVKPWLVREGVVLDERASFIDGTLEVGELSLKIADPRGAFTSLVRSWKHRVMSRLVATLSAAELTTISVDTTTGFPDSGEVWIGQECIHYASKTANTFGNLTRGYYGTRANEHYVDATARPVPISTAVLDGAEMLAGRRANLYAGTVEGGTLSDLECIYRGYIAPDIEAGGAAWSFNVEHIVTMLTWKVCTRLPQSGIKPGYYYPGTAYTGLGAVGIRQINVTTGATIDVAVTIPEGWYTSDTLMTAWNAAVDAAEGAFTRKGPYVRSMGSKFLIEAAGNTTYRLVITIREGDPLNALGFDAGQHATSNVADAWTYEADNGPAQAVTIVPGPMEAGITKQPLVKVDNAGIFTAGLYVITPEAQHIRIATVDDATTVRLAIGSADNLRRADLGIGPVVLKVSEADKLTLQHVFAFRSDTVKTAMQKLLGLYPGQVEPLSWCITGITDDDIDWNELDVALSGAPYELTRVIDTITEPVEFDKFIVDRLGLLGIAPRITTQGRIGFMRMRVPNEYEASAVEVNSAVWERMKAAEVKTQIEGEPLLNQIRVKHSFDYTTRKWPADSSVTYEDGIANLGKTRFKEYQLRGLLVSPANPVACFGSVDLMMEAIAYRAVGTHFGPFGRVAPVIAIPCTWKAKQLNIGDIVSITHPTLVDVAAGTVGVTGRLGIVVGRVGAVTDNAPDQLLVQLPPVTNVGPIAPAALATSWNAGTKTLTFASVSLFRKTGETDLTHFAAGMPVAFQHWDSEAPLAYPNSTIVSVGASTMVLATDPFTAFGGFTAQGAVVRYPNYDAATAAQKEWLYQADTAYSLGPGADDGYVWSI